MNIAQTAPEDAPASAAAANEADPRAARKVLLENPFKRRPKLLEPLLLTTPDNITLRCAAARPAHPRGTVVILTGRGDYIERHYELIDELLERDYAVVTFDWRGQGYSQRLLKNRLKGYVRTFDDYETDLETVMRELVLPDMPPPHYALAISMGGHILLRASWKHMWFERGMLISPMVAFARHPHERLYRLLARVAPLLGLSTAFLPGFPKHVIRPEDAPDNAITSDEERYRREALFLREYPDVGMAIAPTIGWVRAALDSMRKFDRMVAQGDEPRWPMLALAAAHDRLVNPEALRRLARDVGNIEAIFLHKARHDITVERDEIRAQFWAAFEWFIEREATT